MSKKDKAIKIPVKKVKKIGKQDKTLGSLEDAGFEVSHIDSGKGDDMQVLSKGLIRLKFSKFLKLIISRDFDDLMGLYKDEDIVLDADFLVELAGESKKDEELADDEGSTSNVLTGILIGILISFILFLIYIN